MSPVTEARTSPSSRSEKPARRQRLLSWCYLYCALCATSTSPPPKPECFLPCLVVIPTPNDTYQGAPAMGIAYIFHAIPTATFLCFWYFWWFLWLIRRALQHGAPYAKMAHSSCQGWLCRLMLDICFSRGRDYISRLFDVKAIWRARYSESTLALLVAWYWR